MAKSGRWQPFNARPDYAITSCSARGQPLRTRRSSRRGRLGLAYDPAQEAARIAAETPPVPVKKGSAQR